MATLSTVTEVDAEITLYETARNSALLGQSYSIGSRSKSMPALAAIEKRLSELRELRLRLSSGPARNLVRFHDPQ